PKRRRIRCKCADAREFGHRGTEGFNDFLLAALTLVPWSQPSEGDALRRCWSSGNDKVRFRLWHLLEHRFQLAGVSIHETNGRPFGPHGKADTGAAVLDGGKLRLNGGENEIAASRDDQPNEHHERADLEHTSQSRTVAVREPLQALLAQIVKE